MTDSLVTRLRNPGHRHAEWLDLLREAADALEAAEAAVKYEFARAEGAYDELEAAEARAEELVKDRDYWQGHAIRLEARAEEAEARLSKIGEQADYALSNADASVGHGLLEIQRLAEGLSTPTPSKSSSSTPGVSRDTNVPNFDRLAADLDRLAAEDLYDPEINVRYGAWYLHHLLLKYRDEQDALAAYNAGQDNVDRWRRAGKGIQFAETRAYVDRVEQLKRIYRRAYGPELGA